MLRAHTRQRGSRCGTRSPLTRALFVSPAPRAVKALSAGMGAEQAARCAADERAAVLQANLAALESHIAELEAKLASAQAAAEAAKAAAADAAKNDASVAELRAAAARAEADKNTAESAVASAQTEAAQAHALLQAALAAPAVSQADVDQLVQTHAAAMRKVEALDKTCGELAEKCRVAWHIVAGMLESSKETKALLAARNEDVAAEAGA
jgi:hypothetical protein